jgi:Rhs element Vgr protein
MAESTDIENADLSTYLISVDGKEISGHYQLFQVMCYKGINKIAYGKLMISDGDSAAQDFIISSTGEFVPGAEIEIQLGYHSDNKPVFKGIITKHAIKSRKVGPPHLLVEFRDAAFQMTVGRKNKYYFDNKDSDIISEIVSEYKGLTADVQATDVTHARMVKYYCTDWDFINYRADANGKLVFVNDGTLTVKAPDASVAPVATFTYGTNSVLEFEAETDARNQVKAVSTASWDFASQKLAKGEGKEPTEPDQGAMSSADLSKVLGLDSFDLKHTGHVGDEELKAWADSALQRSRFSKIKGRVKIKGRTSIAPGDVIELGGVGDQFNGNAYVVAVSQEMSRQTWTTNIEFGLDPEPYCEKGTHKYLGAAGLLPPVSGLQIGVVNALEGDPESEERVQVKVPMIDAEDDGVWCRVSTLDAGENRGSFFRPEIGDEVVLGFLNDDPRDGILLGMLNSSAKPAPIVAADDNHEKGFVTRSELKLLFNDDTNVITIETPNGNTLIFSDDETSITMQDENGNSTVLDADGILHTDANGNTVTMSSDGIALDSAADIAITAAGDVNIEGINVNCIASAEFVGEGSAGAKLSSGAIATVEGGVVMIN